MLATFIFLHMSKHSHNSRCPGCYHFNLPGEAEAKKDSTIAEAKADEQRMEAKLSNDTEIARWQFCWTVFSKLIVNWFKAIFIRAKRDYELKKAQYDTEVMLTIKGKLPNKTTSSKSKHIKRRSELSVCPVSHTVFDPEVKMPWDLSSLKRENKFWRKGKTTFYRPEMV